MWTFLLGEVVEGYFLPAWTSTVTCAEQSLCAQHGFSFADLLVNEGVGGTGCVRCVQGSCRYASRECWLVSLGEAQRNCGEKKEEGIVFHDGRDEGSGSRGTDRKLLIE